MKISYILLLSLTCILFVLSSVYADNLDDGRQWLKKMALEPGVVTHESGLLYRILDKSPTNIHPELTDTVVVHYEGQLINGKIFDTTYTDDYEPAEFPLNKLIQGWAIGIPLMSPGDEFELFIPTELAYGAREIEDVIPAYSALYFRIHFRLIVGK